MENVGIVRLYLLRAMYLLIAFGLGTSVIPHVITTSGDLVDPHTVINSILIGFFFMALLGIRYPLKMLPILLLELVWKSFWLLVFALPMYLNHELDQYTRDVAFACVMGVVLTPLVVPWGYVINHYVLAKGSAWR
ncbi:hypothetical protein [Cellvibrio polysaccharolyticus]|uniref:Uncharacterized protein n=1 Tax=Cellvibrio polysaccharolyticus TaxID=2082724 RepID=A0A928UZJ5_9GAMM|nr:hypothetical protein [Cellvibrio polysaccharolyticus]MBE8715958.1 hypothetical protein [Cellvibrio polysaccharolyticus]